MTELSDLQDKVIVMKGTIDQITASVNSTVTAQLAAEVELISQSLLNLSTKNPIAVREDMDVEVRKRCTWNKEFNSLLCKLAYAHRLLLIIRPDYVLRLAKHQQNLVGLGI